MMLVNDKYLSSQQESAEIIWAVTVGGAFSNRDHVMSLIEERHDKQKNRDDADDAKLKGLAGYLIGSDRRLILRAKNARAWMNV